MLINLEHIDFNTIKNDLYKYLESRDDYKDVLKSIGSNLDMFLSIFAGYATWSNFKYRQLRKETYLSTATLESSVYKIAKTFGYNINRPQSPTLKIQYKGEKTIELKCGDVIGNYKDKDIIYMNEDKFYENNDFINVKIGHSFTSDIKVNNFININIKPNINTYIDNKVYFRYKNKVKEITKNVENYIVFKEVIDYSNSIYDTQILIADKDNFYGLYDIDEQSQIIYLETDGKEDININDINLNEHFIFYDILSNGTLGDSLEKIRYLTPFYFNALRRMVTIKDHKYILEANEYIKSVFVERDDGLPAIYKISNDGTYVNIFGNIYNADNLTDLYNKIQYNKNTIAVLYDDYIELKTKNGRILEDFYIETDYDLEQSFEGKKPLCCTILVWYIHRDTFDNPKQLNDFEMKELDKYTSEYKMVGTKLMFIPAEKIEKNININISLIDIKYYDKVKEEIYKILNNYELQLNKDFLYGNFIVEVSNIKIFDEELQNYVKPVIYMTPNQEIFDFINNGRQYLKFKNIDISIKV